MGRNEQLRGRCQTYPTLPMKGAGLSSRAPRFWRPVRFNLTAPFSGNKCPPRTTVAIQSSELSFADVDGIRVCIVSAVGMFIRAIPGGDPGRMSTGRPINSYSPVALD